MSDTVYKFAPGYQGCRKLADNDYGDTVNFDWYRRAEP